MKKILGALFLCGIKGVSYAEDALPSSPVENFVFKTDHIPSYEATFIKMLITLGGLLALVFLTIWILRKASNGRFGSMGTHKKIIVLEKKPLSPKTLLYLIELDGKKILISESQLEVRTISHPIEEDMF
ncbi:MAG: flagellar biosynthetic protein FliO [Chlamydiota bacterium]